MDRAPYEGRYHGMSDLVVHSSHVTASDQTPSERVAEVMGGPGGEGIGAGRYPLPCQYSHVDGWAHDFGIGPPLDYCSLCSSY